MSSQAISEEESGRNCSSHLIEVAPTSEILVGTWTAAWWAVRVLPEKRLSHLSRAKAEAN